MMKNVWLIWRGLTILLVVSEATEVHRARSSLSARQDKVEETPKAQPGTREVNAEQLGTPEAMFSTPPQPVAAILGERGFTNGDRGIDDQDDHRVTPELEVGPQHFVDIQLASVPVREVAMEPDPILAGAAAMNASGTEQRPGGFTLEDAVRMSFAALTSTRTWAVPKQDSTKPSNLVRGVVAFVFIVGLVGVWLWIWKPNTFYAEFLDSNARRTARDVSYQAPTKSEGSHCSDTVRVPE